MLTGDNATMAGALTDKRGITEVEAEVLPEAKSKVVKRFRAQSRVVAMASMTHPHRPPPTSASPWAPGQKSPWKALKIRF